MPENLDQMAALAAEHVEIAAVRIALQRLLHLDRQAVHAAPHIGVPRRHLGNDRARREAFSHNRALLLLAPAPPALNAGDNLNPRHRTVVSTNASTVLCTGAKPASHPSTRRPSPDGYSKPNAAYLVGLR